MTSPVEKIFPRPSGLLIMVLAMLTMVSPLATDMYLPAFPEMAGDLGSSATGIQLTLTAFLIGLALGQLVIGPLSDGIGRRRPLIVGTAICLLASAACAIAPTIELMTAARFVQGFSGAAGVVLARAVISDTARGAVAAKLMSLMMIIGGIAPVLAPVAGGAIILTLGWRGVFWVITGLVALMLVGAVAFVKETLPAEQRQSGGLKTMLRSGGAVLGNRSYLGYTLTFVFAFGAMFAYISASPFVLQNILGLSTLTYSITFGINSLGLVISSAVAMRLAGRVDIRKVLGGGVIALFLTSAGLLAVILTGVNTVGTLVLLFAVLASLGFIFGNATALALGQVTSHAGTGSAFLGAAQFILGAAVSPLVGLAGENDARPMGIAMLVLAALSLACFLTLARRGAGDGTTSGSPEITEKGPVGSEQLVSVD
jgi:DHA1 family bicyclomycin/chloramphenicol resistance-like MFS transporter